MLINRFAIFLIKITLKVIPANPELNISITFLMLQKDSPP